MTGKLLFLLVFYFVSVESLANPKRMTRTRTRRASRARHAHRTHTGAIRATRDTRIAQPSGDIKHTGGRNTGGGHLYARPGAYPPTRDPPM
jgi:hypothetical protein